VWGSCREGEAPLPRVAVGEILRGEQHENVHRKDFTDAERLAITEALAERERAVVKERERSTRIQDGKAPGGGKLPPPEKGKTRDHVAKATGVGARTAGKLLALADAARSLPIGGTNGDRSRVHG